MDSPQHREQPSLVVRLATTAGAVATALAARLSPHRLAAPAPTAAADGHDPAGPAPAGASCGVGAAPSALAVTAVPRCGGIIHPSDSDSGDETDVPAGQPKKPPSKTALQAMERAERKRKRAEELASFPGATEAEKKKARAAAKAKAKRQERAAAERQQRGLEQVQQGSAHWQNSETVALITAYGVQTRRSLAKGGEFWAAIAMQLRAKSVIRQEEACKQKWKALRKGYSDAIALRNKSGEGRDETATCPYFEELHAVLQSDERIHPVHVAEAGVDGGSQDPASQQPTSTPAAPRQVNRRSRIGDAIAGVFEKVIQSVSPSKAAPPAAGGGGAAAATPQQSMDAAFLAEMQRSNRTAETQGALLLTAMTTMLQANGVTVPPAFFSALASAMPVQSPVTSVMPAGGGDSNAQATVTGAGVTPADPAAALLATAQRPDIDAFAPHEEQGGGQAGDSSDDA